MATRNLRTRIKFLDEDIASCEASVLSMYNRNVKRAKESLPMSSKRNTKEKRSVKKTDLRLSSSDRKKKYSYVADPLLPNNSCRVKCNIPEQFVSKSGTAVEANICTNKSESSKTSCSMVSITNGGHSQQSVKERQKKVLEKLIANSPSKTIRHKIRGSKLTKSRRETWGELLREQSKPVFPIKDIRSKPITRSNLSRCKQQRRRRVDVDESRHNNSSVSSYSSDVEGNVEETAPHGGLPKCSNEDAKPVRLKLQDTTDVSYTFAMFDPIRTMRFLVTELQGVTEPYCSDIVLRRIVSDLENTLLRLPKDYEDTDNVTTTSLAQKYSDSTILPATSKLQPIPLRLQETYSMKSHAQKQTKPVPINISRATSPMEEVKMDAHTESYLKESCASLKRNIQQMETSIEGLKREKGLLELDLKAKQDDVQLLITKEQAYLKALSIQQTKMGELCQTLKEMTKQKSHLQKDNQTLCETRDKLSQEIITNCDMMKNLKVDLQKSIANSEKLRVQLLISNMKLERQQVLDECNKQDLSTFEQGMLELQNVATEELAKLSNEKITNVMALPNSLPGSSSRNSSLTPGPEEAVSWCDMSSVVLGQPKMLVGQPEKCEVFEQVKCVELSMESTQFQKPVLGTVKVSCTDVTNSKENNSNAIPIVPNSAEIDLGFTIFKHTSFIEESMNASKKIKPMENKVCNKENDYPLHYVNVSVDTTNSIDQLRDSTYAPFVFSAFPVPLSVIQEPEEVMMQKLDDKLTTQRFYSITSVPSSPLPPSGIAEPGGESQWSELQSISEGSNKESK